VVCSTAGSAEPVSMLLTPLPGRCTRYPGTCYRHFRRAQAAVEKTGVRMQECRSATRAPLRCADGGEGGQQLMASRGVRAIVSGLRHVLWRCIGRQFDDDPSAGLHHFLLQDRVP